TSREVHEMFKTTAIDTLKQDKKCQACWYMILSTMSGSTTIKHMLWVVHPLTKTSACATRIIRVRVLAVTSLFTWHLCNLEFRTL
ncbi:MAG: hypothetical protein WBE68_17410, partial [Candidatus Nitrosopolaris sp.]